VAVLLLRIAENKRKRPPDGAPDFLQYGSRFIAMLMGIFLLEDLKTDLAGLTHQKFAEAKKLIESQGEQYFDRALNRIDSELKKEYRETEISLQKLSATFRRADLVEKLRGGAVMKVDLTLDDLFN
jgi:hypothetical protein